MNLISQILNLNSEYIQYMKTVLHDDKNIQK